MSEENGKRSGVLHMTYQGATVDFELSEKSVGQIEQFIDGLLSRGWAPTNAAPSPNPTTAATSDEPPICQNRNCSNYGKPMAEGRYSKWACRGKDATTGNQKGYCKSQAD